MNTEQVVVYGVLGLIFVTTLASGPLVGTVDLTAAPEQPTADGGDATVGNVTLPEQATITKGRFGSGGYYLQVPATMVELDAVDGRPMLAYEFASESLGYWRTTTHFVSSSHVGLYRLTMEQAAFDEDEISTTEYEGQLNVLVRSNESERVVATANITVGVDE